jgi:hypothetical protein
LPVLYEYETLRKEHRLWVFRDSMLRKIFGPKMDEITVGWRRLHNEELPGLYSSPSIAQVCKSRMRGTGHVTHVGERSGVNMVFIGKQTTWKTYI